MRRDVGRDEEEAADRIVENRYADELRARGVQDIVLLGISFAGKEVWFESQQG